MAAGGSSLHSCSRAEHESGAGFGDTGGAQRPPPSDEFGEYTDITSGNILVGRARTWVVDWSWPTVGAAFIDPVMFVLQLLSNGYPPSEAEKWAEGCPAWTNADPRTLDVFVAATVRQQARFAARRPEEPWRKAMLDAATAWLLTAISRYRHDLEPRPGRFLLSGSADLLLKPGGFCKAVQSSLLETKQSTSRSPTH